MRKPIILRDSLSLKPKSSESIETRLGKKLGEQYIFGEKIGPERGRFLASSGFTILGSTSVLPLMGAVNPTVGLAAGSMFALVKVINTFIGARCISNHRNEAVSEDLQSAAKCIQAPRTVYLIEDASSFEEVRKFFETPRGSYFTYDNRLFYTPAVEIPKAVQRCWVVCIESALPQMRGEVRRLIARGVCEPENV